MSDDTRGCDDSSCTEESCAGCSHANADGSCAGGGIKKEQMLGDSQVKKVIGVVSGKGGVGKSLITSLLAAEMNRAGHPTAILDADMTGPSIPRVFGLKGVHVRADGEGIIPPKSKGGVTIMSANLILPDETDPVIWRGPVVSNAIRQFYSEVHWGDIDFMFVDMPPGTGDVPLTVFQSLPVDGIVIVATPQELVGMIVTKAVKMAAMMEVPVLALVENMSYYVCPDCGSQVKLFGKGHADYIVDEYKIPVLAKLPVDPAVAEACDAGDVESIERPELAPVVEALKALL